MLPCRSFPPHISPSGLCLDCKAIFFRGLGFLTAPLAADSASRTLVGQLACAENELLVISWYIMGTVAGNRPYFMVKMRGFPVTCPMHQTTGQNCCGKSCCRAALFPCGIILIALCSEGGADLPQHHGLGKSKLAVDLWYVHMYA